MWKRFETMNKEQKRVMGQLFIALPIAVICAMVTGYTLGWVVASTDPQAWAAGAGVTAAVAAHIWSLSVLRSRGKNS